MKSTETTVSELSFVFKLLPLLQEADTIDRLYRRLLAIVTSGHSIGYTRAVLLVPDEEDGIIRGRFGAERSKTSAVPSAPQTEDVERVGFDEMARSVFRTLERIEASDFTVKVRSYSVPMNWYRSAIVKATRTTYPVLADRGLSEFVTDTFFDFFGVTSYIVLPIEVSRRVAALLAVDLSSQKASGYSDQISILYSLVQQTAGSAERLLERSIQRRRARVLAKLHDSLRASGTSLEFEESLKAVLAMVCRAVDGSGCLLKSQVSQTTTRVESTMRRRQVCEDAAVAAAMDKALDLAAGTLKPVGGDGSHPCLGSDGAERIAFFFACPLLVGRESVGALAVYVDKDDNRAKLDDFGPGDKVFLRLCADVMASAAEDREKLARIGRLEEFVEEMGSNLARERERSRLGDRSVEFHTQLAEDLRRLERIVTKSDAPAHLDDISNTVRSMQSRSGTYWDELLADKSGYAMTDLFQLVRRAVEAWRPAAEKRGVEVTSRIPDGGASLLLDGESIARAMEKILTATLSCLGRKDKVLVECSLTDDRALVCVADTGTGLPGDTISRLFMPFVDTVDPDEGKRALSLAGDILQKHSAEIIIRSSRSWRTILVLSFPRAAGRDRRKRGSDRRRRGDRRVGSPSG